MRKQYETKGDRQREQAVLSLIDQLWKCESVKLPKQYRLDYGILRGDHMTALAEVKVRNVRSDKYATLMVSAEKIRTGMDWASKFPMKFILFVGYEDGIFWCDASNLPWATVNYPGIFLGIGGRKDRNDWQDVEPVVHIPKQLFKRVALTPEQVLIWEDAYAKTS